MARRGSRYLPPHGRMRVLRRAPRPKAEAVEAETPTPKSEPAPEPKRARDEDGQYKADDPGTPEVNEAYVGGEPKALPFDRKMTKSQLLQIAKKMGIEGLSMEMRKSDILDALKKAK
jgi:hypothetical protein